MNKDSIAKGISAILVLFLCIGLLGFFSQMKNDSVEEFESFSVTYNGNELSTSRNKLFFSRGTEHTFDVTYTFEFLDEGEEAQTDYTVRIIPCVTYQTDFDFTVDGTTYVYSSVEDLSDGFQLNKYDTYFTLTIPEDISLESVLEAVYGKDVEAPKDEACANPYLYTLVITSHDESVTYYIDFAFSMSVTEIKLNTDKVAY